MLYNNNGNEIAYNNFIPMPQIPYKIVERLALVENSSAQSIWKLLKYATVDALSKPNLTFDEKMDMIWSPDKPNASQENLFSVFLKPLVASALNEAEEQIQLRIFRPKTKPNTTIEASLVYQFDIITQEMCCQVYDAENFLVERTDLIEAYLLDCLNGADIGIGTSFLTFDNRMMSGYIGSSLSINNSKSLFGRSLFLGLNYINATSTSSGCR